MQHLDQQRHQLVDFLLAVHPGEPLDGVQRIMQKMRVDLAEQLLDLELALLLLVMLDFVNQPVDLGLHFLEIAEQQVEFLDLRIGDRCLPVLRHADNLQIHFRSGLYTCFQMKRASRTENQRRHGNNQHLAEPGIDLAVER